MIRGSFVLTRKRDLFHGEVPHQAAGQLCHAIKLVKLCLIMSRSRHANIESDAGG